MSDLPTKAVRSLYDSLISRAKTSHGLWEEIAQYMKPQRLGIQSEFSPGSDLTQYMYDSTALTASKDCADAVHFALANPFITWFNQTVVTPDDDDIPPEITDWCQDNSRVMRTHMMDSNFTAAMNEAINDVLLFGNTCVEAEQMPGDRFELAFMAHHVRDAVPMIGAFGRIEGTIMEKRMTVQAMAEQFAPDEWNAGDMEGLKAKLGKRAAALLKKDKLQDEIRCLHAIYRRKTVDVELDEKTGLGEPEKRPFASIWLTHDEQAHPLKVGGYYEQPRFWARFRRRTDDPMGGGIGEIALPDTYTANEQRRQGLDMADKEIDPPWASEGQNLLGDLDQRSNGVTEMRDIDKSRPLPQNFKGAAFKVHEDIRQSIRDIWMADEIKLPPREKVGQMTAYEVAKRIERIYQLLGPEIDRIHKELLRPLLERVFGILKRAGKFQEMPESLLQLAEERGATLEFKFTGPAVRSQYGEEIAALDDTLGYAMQVAEVKPDVLDNIDIDAHLKKRAELTDYPMDLFVDPAEVKKTREERAKQEQAMQGAAVAKDASQAVKNMGGPEAMQQGLSLVGEDAA